MDGEDGSMTSLHRRESRRPQYTQQRSLGHIYSVTVQDRCNSSIGLSLSATELLLIGDFTSNGEGAGLLLSVGCGWGDPISEGRKVRRK